MLQSVAFVTNGVYWLHMPYQLVCVGDTTLDTFLKVRDATIRRNPKTKDCELCFKHGEKISVDELRQNPGGNSANVAVGAAALGVKTALYAVIGDDDIGKKIKRMINERGINTKYLSMNKGRSSNYSTIINFKGERTIFEMKYPARLSFKTFPKTKWVYLSSIKQNPKTVYGCLIRLKKTLGFKIAFNPGMFQLSHPSDDIVQFLKFVDVLILNKEEARLLCEKIPNDKSQIPNKLQTPNPKPKKAPLRAMRWTLAALHSFSNSVVFVTDGKRGAYGYDGNKFVHCGVFPVSNVKDKTGAGDAFSSGVISGLIRGVPFPWCIHWGIANSAAVLTEIGPQNGLLNYQKLKLMLAKNKIHPPTIDSGTLQS